LLFVVALPLGFRKRTTASVNLSNPDKPLLLLPGTPLDNVYFVYTVVAMCFLTFLLGTNVGTFLGYYTQLLPLPLTLFVISFWYQRLGESKFRQLALLLFAVVFVGGYSTYLTTPAFSQNKQQLFWDTEWFYVHPMSTAIDRTQDDLAWKEAASYIAKHNAKSAYVSPVLSIEATKRGWPMYDNGQTEYYYANQLTQKSQPFGFLSPRNEEIAARLESWQNDLDRKIVQKKFSLVVLPKAHYPLLDEEHLRTYYAVKKTVRLSILPASLSTLEFWEPKEE
jgi:hypothetical protein